FFFSRRRRHTRFSRDWSSDVCSSDLVRETHDDSGTPAVQEIVLHRLRHEARVGMAAEHAAVVVEARYRNGLVDRPPLGAADEGGYGDGRTGRRRGGALERFGKYYRFNGHAALGDPARVVSVSASTFGCG